MEIRSYRRVFDLERRIYRIDRLRLNPTGVPVRGIVYYLALLAGALILSRVPPVALIASELPWYARDVVLPGLAATLLAVIRIDGRSFHLAARSLLLFRLRARRLVQLRASGAAGDSHVGLRWAPPPLVMIPDGSEPTLRRLRFTGPGAVRVDVRHRREDRDGLRARLGRGAHVVVDSPAGARAGAEVIVLERNARLEVR